MSSLSAALPGLTPEVEPLPAAPAGMTSSGHGFAPVTPSGTGRIPHGFSTIPAGQRSSSTGHPGCWGRRSEEGSDVPNNDPAASSVFAAQFAMDYLSWDEDDPQRRGVVLARYLARTTPAEAAELGWSGSGRQRADFCLVGKIVAGTERDPRVSVDVRVLVTPYMQVPIKDSARRPVDPEVVRAFEAGLGGDPSAAPAPHADGWMPLASRWLRLDVTVWPLPNRQMVVLPEELSGVPNGLGDFSNGFRR